MTVSVECGTGKMKFDTIMRWDSFIKPRHVVLVEWDMGGKPSVLSPKYSYEVFVLN